MTKLNRTIKALRQRITSGEFKVGSKIPSEYELANNYEINKGTANKAVTTLVNEGYLKRGKRGSGTYVLRTSIFPLATIAYIGTLNEHYYSRIIRSVSCTAEENNYLLAFFTPPFPRLEELIAKLNNSNIEGILTASYGRLDKLTDLPIIHIDRHFIAEPEINRVGCDDYKGGVLQARELLKHKHRDIVYCTAQNSLEFGSARWQGFRQELLDNEVPNVDERHFSVSHTAIGPTSILRKISAKFPNCSAIGCYSDIEANGLINAAEQMGYNLLEKTSVIGFGNVFRTEHNLTTIEQHPEEIGREACLSMIEMLTGKLPTIGLDLKVDTELIPGGSVSYHR